MRVDGDAIRVAFEYIDGGLVSCDGQPLTHFTIAGADGKFVPAHAEIRGDEVVVHADAVQEPTAVRFAWHEEAEPNLSNRAGLPAGPFRTDK
jgi:sialate O-acetylesterase